MSNADANESPTFAEVIEIAAEMVARRSLGGWLPGRIESYDAGTNRAVVQPLLLENGEDERGKRVARRIAAITDVPVWFMAGGGVRIRFPLNAGDTVYLLFGARSMDKYKAVGGEVDPEDDVRHHDISDAIAIPAQIVNPSNADAFIEFTGDGLIKAGGDQPLVTKAEFDSHTHPVSVVTTCGSGAGTGTGTAAIGAPVTGTPRLRG